MISQIQLRFEKGGVVKATLLQEKAPETIKVVLASLPAELEAIHAKWAGDEIFADNFPISREFEAENETSEVKPGDVGLVSPRIQRALARKGSSSFCIFYGKSRARKSVDETIDINIFAKADDVEDLAKIGKRIRIHGIEKVNISAVP